jgi:DNA-binding NarL/FixJ family response regulator
LRFAAAGWTNDRFAVQLFLSPRKVQTYVTTDYRTLNVANRADAVRATLEVGLA